MGGDEEEFIMLSLRLKSGLNYYEFEENSDTPSPLTLSKS